MRNLKKVLSLVLAMVMTMSLATAAMAATAPTTTTAATGTTATSSTLDFTDADDIENVDEVALLNALGVLAGYEDGSYQPDKTVTRAEAAKIVCYLLLGADVGDSLADADVTTGFTDVDGQGYDWASGYIQYCASVGIINGYGDNLYGPDDAVTTYQLAKMLLCALGYGVNDEYVGSSWATNVAVDAIKNKVMPKGTINEDCTRDMTALLAYMTLFADQVVYTTDKSSYTKSVDSSVIGTLAANNFALAEAEGTLTYTAETTTADAYYSVTDTNDTTTTTDDVTVELDAAIADIGRTISFWYMNTGTEKKPVYEPVTAYETTDTVVTTVTDGTFLYNGADSVQYTAPSAKYYVNGELATTTTEIAAAKAAADVKGNSVVLIDTDGTAKTIETVLVTAKTVAVVTGDYKTKTATNGDVTVYVPTYTGAVGTSSSYVAASGYEKLTKGDVILVQTCVDDVSYITVASSFDGYISATGTTKVVDAGTTKAVDYVTVGGTKYYASELTGAMSSNSSLDGFIFGSVTPSTITNTYYTDDAGYIIGAIVTDTAAASGNYMLATDVAFIEGTKTGLSTTADSVQANVLYTDGTVGTITISTIDTYIPVEAGATSTTYVATSGGSDYVTNPAAGATLAAYDGTTAVTLIGVSATTSTNTTLNDNWYKYVKNTTTGKYALTTVATSGTTPYSADLTGAAITGNTNYKIITNTAKFDGTLIANSKTVFLVETLVSGKAVFTAYTGIANLPSVKATQNVTGTALLSGGVCTFVYINAGAVVGAANLEQVFVRSSTPTKTLIGSTVYDVYSVIMDGAVTTITAETGLGLTAGTMYDLYTDSNGYATEISGDPYALATGSTSDYYVGVNSVSGGVISVGGKTDVTGTYTGLAANAFTYDGSTTVSVISYSAANGYEVNTVAAGGIDEDVNDLVYVYSKDGTYANEIIVIKQYLPTTLASAAVSGITLTSPTSFAPATTAYTGTISLSGLGIVSGTSTVTTSAATITPVATSAGSVVITDASGATVTGAYTVVATGTTLTLGSTYTVTFTVTPTSASGEVTGITTTYTFTLTVVA